MEADISITGPEFEVRLSPLDARYPGLFSRRLLIFKPSGMNKSRITEVLQEAVQRLVHQIPILAATVIPAKDEPGYQAGWGGFEKSPGLPLKIKDESNSISISDLEERNIRPEDLPDSLLVPVSPDLSKPPYPACELQLTFAADAAILAVCIAHMVGDGPGMTTIISLLAEHCRTVQDAPSGGNVSSLPQLGLDRSPYLNLKGSLTRVEDHPAYSQRTETKSAPAGYTAPESSDIVTKIYTISSQNLQALKQLATGSTRISSHDAISALIWRLLILNRLASGTITQETTPKTSYFVAVNTRRHMGVAPSYIGNTVYQTHATLSLPTLLSDNNLCTSAVAIRKAINTASKERMHGLVNAFHLSSDIRSIQWRGPAHSLTRDIVGMSFYHSEEIYQNDWGSAFGGKVARMRCTDLGFTGCMRGTHYIMPLEEGRGCEVQMSLERSGIAAVESDELFRRFFSTRSLDVL